MLRSTATNAAGAYEVAGLTPATYNALADAPHFNSVNRDAISLAVNSMQRVDFHLPIQGGKSTIEVTANVQMVQTESGSIGSVISQNQINALPLNQRDFLQLALLLPGVMPPVEGSELSTRSSFSMHANGGREEYNNFLLGWRGQQRSLCKSI